jgi:tRNA(Ile)-lysidine synthase
VVNLVQQVEQAIGARSLFRDGEAVLVAVSGGVDSMVLLRLLHRLSVEHHWRLVVAHFNHQLRGRSSDADERLVRATAKGLGLRYVAGHGDVKRLRRRQGLSLEMAARQLRHAFLARTARRLGIRAVALAHHADDQVELFFVRLLRGAGTEGLAGMKWSGASPSDHHVRLVRPMLGCTKESLRQFARAERIPFREDATNTSADILRNRVRRELLPLLERRYQPALAKTTPRLMEILGADAEFVAETARTWLGRKGRPAFDRLPVAVQRGCLHLQLARLGGNRPDFDLIEKLRQSPGVRIAVGPRLSVSRDGGGTVHQHTISRTRFGTGRLWVDLTGDAGVCVFDGVAVSWQSQRRRGAGFPKRAAGREYFDAEKVGPQVVLRHWCRGDRFQPIGMARPVKLQDWFTNRKVPREQRHRLLVAATAAREVFWVEGERIGERFKLDKSTVRRLKWSWKRG